MREMPCGKCHAAYSSFSPGGKWACYASVNSEYTYCDFLKTPGFTALIYAKVCDFCVIFDRVSSVNFETNPPPPPHPPFEIPSVRHCICSTIICSRNNVLIINLIMIVFNHLHNNPIVFKRMQYRIMQNILNLTFSKTL